MPKARAPVQEVVPVEASRLLPQLHGQGALPSTGGGRLCPHRPHLASAARVPPGLQPGAVVVLVIRIGLIDLG